MNSLERLKLVLDGKIPDRVPIFYSAVSELSKFIEDDTGCGISSFENDVLKTDYLANFSWYKANDLKKYEDGSYDTFLGVRTKDQNYGIGIYQETIENPLAKAGSIKEIEEYPFPPQSKFAHDEATDIVLNNPTKGFVNGYHGIMYYAWQLRGMEQFLEDLLVDESIAEALIERITDFLFESYFELLKIARSKGIKNYICINLSDDFGTQKGLMISPGLYRKFFKKPVRRIADLIHSFDIKVEFHCCGSIIELIDELIDSGVDVLNPIQTSAAGMNPGYLKERWGKDLVFCGGVDVQTILANGTCIEVRKEVKHLLDTLGRNGGYIFGPSHWMQVDTNMQNVYAMYDALYDYYGMPNYEIKKYIKCQLT